MSEPIKFPSARQPVTLADERGVVTFTRPWILFFQQVYERVGGPIAASTPDLAESLFEDAGSSETNAALFSIEQGFGQQPPQTLVEAVESLMAELATQRDTIAEMQKEIDGLKQGQMI